MLVESTITIQRYLLLLILSIIVLATFGAALHGYRASMSQFDDIFDSELRSLAQSLSTLNVNVIQEEQTDQITKTEHNSDANSFIFQIWRNDRLINKSPFSPKSPLMAFQPGFSQQNFNGKRWKTFSLKNNEQWIMVAQPIKLRVQSAEAVLLEAIAPIVLAIPLIALLVLFAIRKSLAPLRELSTKVKQKSPDDLSTISLKRTSVELNPIIGTLNNLLNRMANAFSREKRLASDAAHELRTPISVLNITAHNLQHEYNTQAIKSETLTELQQGVTRMAHVIEQILLLNRTAPEQFSKQFEPLDIELVLQKAINNVYTKIDEKQQSISLQSESMMMLGDEFSLVTLFENLISNANKYCEKHCEIVISAQIKPQKLTVSVEDSGKGLTEEQMAKAFDRFYRAQVHEFNQPDASKSVAVGCGLGLSIVEHIVTLHNGSVKLEKSSLGGLRVITTFGINKSENRQERTSNA